MKTNKYILSVVMASVSMVGFTSCNTDDPLVTLDPVEKIEAEEGESTLKVPTEVVRVKIGNDILVPVEGAQGTVAAVSLNEDVVKIVDSPNGPMIQGLKNGKAAVLVSDDTGNYKSMPISVYTTETMQLSHTSYEFVTVLGKSATSKECSVVLGNGLYTIESDNPRVRASIDVETGAITLTATAGVENFVANVTVHDVSGLEATIAVTVKATFDAFTQDELNALISSTEPDVDYNGSHPYYFEYYKEGYGPNYGSMGTRTENGVTTTGYECIQTWYSYGLQLNYPAGTALNTEVDGSLSYTAGSKRNYEGKIKILVDNDEKFVGIWYKIDLKAEKITRGHVVWIKNR